jgi:protein SCO1/2
MSPLSQAIPVRWALPALLVVATALAGCAPPSDQADDATAVRVLPYPLEKPDFTFADVEGRPYHFRSETEGFVTLLFFGYTHCPDICPIQMANIGAVLRDLPAETQRRIKVVFVTTDPDRDTPERMRQWLGAIHPTFVGLRGPLEEVNAAEAALLLPGSVVEPPHGAATHDEPADYFVGHATPVVVFAADGQARLMYPAGTRQQDWRRDLPRLVAEADAPGEAGR